MTDFLFALAVGVLFAIGVFQLLRRDLIKAAMGFSMLFTAINLFILSTGAYDGVVAPYTSNVEEGLAVSDPLVQALILTAVVVSFGSYALLLGLINIASRRFRTVDSDEVSDLKR
ncbi:NADH-quinone oxidoreductase subunit K [Phototrophicus methaneseepsis]|uniref:NADH-quinone oxidoreductase subunit K n=1 Tax=Phototrophicus methaneseepsis TaxID=2710758 RepID=A0A7S8EDN8_9CHLR|nr:sodium:proton antiporter [Phototrophicus methaneseepsis]QPC85060.1 NADH-quinone oxidoreductase subunit K [Phototrophicus methaneseepsis]